MTKKSVKGAPEGAKAYNATEAKEVLYRLAESYYQGRSPTPLNDQHKQDIRGGIDALVDASLLLEKADPKAAYGLKAVIVAEAAEKFGVQSKEARAYLSQLAAGYAKQAGLEPYSPERTPEQGYRLPDNLAEILFRGGKQGEKPTGPKYGHS